MSNPCTVRIPKQGRCDAPIPDAGQLCSTCTLDLRDALRNIARLAPDVAGAVARQRSSGSKTFTKHRRWTPEAHPLPVDLDAAQVGREVWDLATWCAGKVGGPDGMAPTHQAAAALLLLAADSTALRMDEDAVEVLAAARAVQRAVSALLNAPLASGDTRTYLGDCACLSPLVAPVSALPEATVECKGCGTLHNVGERREQVKVEAEDQWVDPRIAAEWTEAVTGRPRPPERTMRHWRSSGQLSTNANGHVVIARYRELEQRNAEVVARRGRSA